MNVSQKDISRPILNPSGRLKDLPITMMEAVRRIRLSNLFDDRYYITHYAPCDPLVKIFDPISHYLAIGYEKGYLPSPRTDLAFYLNHHSNADKSDINPLLDLVLHGAAKSRKQFLPRYLEREKRSFSSGKKLSTLGIRELRALVPCKKSDSQPALDLIMPVYSGYRETLDAIYSVIKSKNKTSFEFIIIEDCTPNRRLANVLVKLAKIGLFTLIRNNTNLGFVKSVNLALQIHPSRNVLLLNSDTIVNGNWIDRIVAHAKPSVATITPFSNNATLCSYPFIFEDNDIPRDMNIRRLDQISARYNAGKSVEVPTGVGFCLFIARQAIKKVGTFDVRTFGAGYGEENDFCLRAASKGFVNIHALDVFVYHIGGVSFGTIAEERKVKNLVKLLRKHPTYSQKIREFAITDPSRFARQSIDLARLTYTSNRKTVFCFSNRLGGGIERYLLDRQKTRNGKEVLIIARPDLAGNGFTLERIGSKTEFPNLRGLTFAEVQYALQHLLESGSFSHFEIHSLVGFKSSLVRQIPLLSKKIGLAYDFYLHDYAAICPRITLVDDSNRYCGERGTQQCCTCLSKRKPPLPNVHTDILETETLDINSWRFMYGALLADARQVICPSRDAANRLSRYFSGLSLTVVPHESHNPSQVARPIIERNDALPFQIGVLGALAVAKGALIVAECAKAALDAWKQCGFVVIGSSPVLNSLKLPNVLITGEYMESEVQRIIKQSKIDCLLFPSVCPETYLYTLSHGFNSGLPLFVFDLGAQGERITEYSLGYKIPLGTINDPLRILQFIRQKSLLKLP